MKISIIGTGMVGSTVAYRLLVSGLAGEIALYDVNKEKAYGEKMDLLHAMAEELPTRFVTGDGDVLAGSDIVVITAGLPRKEGETRLDLISKNLAIFREIVPAVVKQAPHAMYVIVSNPVDVLTYATITYGGLSPAKVIGTGTMLDTMRFKAILGEYFGVSPSSITAYVIGEHGDSQVACFSSARIAGISLQEYADSYDIERNESIQTHLAMQTKTAGAEIIKRKMATYYGIGSGTVRIIQAIVRNEGVVLPVSTLQETSKGPLCTSLPTLVDASGVRSVLNIPLSEQEKEAFDASNGMLAEYVKMV